MLLVEVLIDVEVFKIGTRQRDEGRCKKRHRSTCRGAVRCGAYRCGACCCGVAVSYDACRPSAGWDGSGCNFAVRFDAGRRGAGAGCAIRGNADPGGAGCCNAGPGGAVRGNAGPAWWCCSW